MPEPRVNIVQLEPPSRSYDVVVGAGELDGLGGRILGRVGPPSSPSSPTTPPTPGRVHVVVDAGLPEDTANRCVDGLRQYLTVTTSLVRPTEDGKTLQTVHVLLGDMTRAGLERSDLVLALGGGIVGDLAGFAAATYRRGIRWINCPTTLLAMVDASVGGKTGCNVRVGPSLKKNMAGAFWQPSLVLADVGVLSSLDGRTFRSGLAECIKHGLIGAHASDPELLRWTLASLAAISSRDAGTLVELVGRNVAVKARIVGSDEREEADDADGGRALLNLGHTFGHAIETLPGVSPSSSPADAPPATPSHPSPPSPPLTHGEAVALGLICAARCAELLKLVGPGLTDHIRRILGHAGLPTVARGLPTSAEILALMHDDKKVAGGKLRLILPSGEHRCTIVTAPPRDAVLEAIDAIRA